MRARAVNFYARDLKLRVLADCRLDKLQPSGQRSDRAPDFVRWVRRDHPQYAIEFQAVARLCRQDQVPNMRRIKGTTKETDSHGSIRPFQLIIADVHRITFFNASFTQRRVDP